MKAILITESLNGYALDLVCDLTRLGYLVIGVAENAKDSEHIKNLVKHRNAHSNIEVLVGDFGSIKGIRQIILNVRLILMNYNLNSLYAIVANRQIFVDEYKENENKIEIQFFENYLANYILCYSLLPFLQNEQGARIILPTLSTKDMNLINFNNLNLKDNYNGVEAFRQAKLANAMMAYEFNRRFNCGEKPVVTFLFQEKLVKCQNYLYVDETPKGMKKLFANDRLFAVRKGINSIISIKKHGESLFYVGNSAQRMCNYSKQEDCEKLFDISKDLGRVLY